MAENPSVTLFRDYLRIKTVQPNPDYQAATAFWKHLGTSRGFKVSVLECTANKPIIIISWEGKDPTLPSILLNSHIDVVPVSYADWKTDPFAAVKDEHGNIYARGSQDMKCITVQGFEALCRLKQSGITLLRTIHLSLVPDEEIGGTDGMEKFVCTEEWKKLNVGFALDEGLASAGEVIPVYYGERAVWWVKIIARGNVGHGSRFIENTSIDKLLRVVKKINRFREDQYKRVQQGEDLGNVTTVNVTRFVGAGGDVGSYQINVIPAEAEIGVDIRIPPSEDLNTFEKRIQEWTSEEGVEYSFIKRSKVNKITHLTPDNVWWNRFIEVMKDHELKFEPKISQVATDSRYLRIIGLPALGFSPMNHTPVLLHDHNEFLNEKIFLKGIDIFVSLIEKFANTPAFYPPVVSTPLNLQSDEEKHNEINIWWRPKRDQLLTLVQKRHISIPSYVYDKEELISNVNKLLSLSAVRRIFYAVKANPSPEILKIFYEKGLGFECVSPEELDHIVRLFPFIDKKRLLFTPNFVERAEYEKAFVMGAMVTLDSLYPLEAWPDLFKSRDIILRIDPIEARGHHKHVLTAGTNSKFGIPLTSVDKTEKLVKAANAKVVGLHAHAGSGILDSSNWARIAEVLYSVRKVFPDVSTLNLGGGLGITESNRGLDLNKVSMTLSVFHSKHPDLELWLEPGRFLVATAGVLLCKVTQLKEKNAEHRFVGVNTGFNHLIRPILYGAYHEIVNLTRLSEEKSWKVDIVGNICESGDVLGGNRDFPITKENDVVLIANTGAYGKAMSSNYNMRTSANEYILSTD
eukprot:TRINITY_DN7606_c0_g1_i1.p1 TRINITY_DN7606_c0_g1~~TRINITY_DN7606_c0_g1_i1.p1  ORF type:complete len:824 (-),score=139.32 TRINITY_DN7606_c0_g1_i1:99-2504(-)